MNPESPAQPIVGIIMGSSSDGLVMKAAATILEQFGVPYEFNVVSAHRSPSLMYDYAQGARARGLRVIIAGAGGAAHLPGMVAALCTLPVIGVPGKSSNSLDGWDSLLSIAQMPNDVPVATVAVNGAHNAGMLAVQMLAIQDEALAEKLAERKAQNLAKVQQQQAEVTSLLRL